jgi:hypothetical protein
MVKTLPQGGVFSFKHTNFYHDDTTGTTQKAQRTSAQQLSVIAIPSRS